MSVKIKAKNQSNILQTLTCDNAGHLNVAFDGLDLTTTNAKLDLIEGKTYSRTKSQIKYTNESLAQNQSSSVFDLSNNISTKCRLWGHSNVHKNLMLQFSDDNSNWHNIEILNVLNISGDLTFNQIIECPPKYIRVFNNQTTTITLDLFLELTF